MTVAIPVSVGSGERIVLFEVPDRFTPSDHLGQALDPPSEIPRCDSIANVDAKHMVGDEVGDLSADTGKLGQEKDRRVIQKLVKIDIPGAGVFPRISVKEHVDEDYTE